MSDFAEAMRTRLNERLAALSAIAAAGDEAAATVELDQQRVGRLSRMEAMQAQAVSAETNRRREVEKRRIEAALLRIESGDYGFCLSCDEPIVEERLRNDPSAPLCITCAGKAERR